MWTITRIEEADYGCEERMPGEPLMVLVTISCDDGRVCSFECPDVWIETQGIDEGDEWPEDIDKMDMMDSRLDNMSKWMEKYYEAVEELEEMED